MTLGLLFIDERLFTVVPRRTHKMIWYLHRWQPRSAASVLIVSLLRTRSAFGKYVTVTVTVITVLKLDSVNLIFVQRAAKINR